MKPRLTYANLMSTIAVFVSLGGGAYAATQLDGTTIAPRSIPGDRIVKGALGSTEVKEAATSVRLNQLLTSSSKAAKRKVKSKRVASAAAGSSAPSGSLVTLNVGEEADLLVSESGSLKLTALCTTNTRPQGADSPEYGKPAMVIYGTSTVSGTLVNWGSRDIHGNDPYWTGKMPSGKPWYFLQDYYTAASPGFVNPNVSEPMVMITPEGEMIKAGWIAGTGVKGSDCFAAAYALI